MRVLDHGVCVSGFKFAVLAGALCLAGCSSSDGTSGSRSGGGASGSVDRLEPVLVLGSEFDGLVSRSRLLPVMGLASDAGGVASVSVSVNGADPVVLSVDSVGNFAGSVLLSAGENEVVVSAVDKVGNVAKQSGRVYLGQTLAAANSHSGALVDGKLYTWGRNNFGQLGLGYASEMGGQNLHPNRPVLVTAAPRDIVSLAFNQNHSAVLTRDGQVYTWGSDEAGELGRGDLGRDSCAEEQDNCRLQIGVVPNLGKVVAISSGYGHTLALTDSGEVWAFGDNDQKQLGSDSVTNSAKPVQVDFSQAQGVGKLVSVLATGSGSFALDDKGQVWAWGTNEEAGLGVGKVCDPYASTPVDQQDCLQYSAKPVLVEFPQTVVIRELAGGSGHVLALTDQGQVYGWGLNFSSQVGYRGETHLDTDQELPETVEKPTLLAWSKQKPAKHIYANGTSSYAMLMDGKIYPWGIYGESTSDPNAVPDYVDLGEPTDKLPALTQVQEMAVGALHQVARREDGSLFTWGWSFEGSLGGGNSTSNSWMYDVPIKIDMEAIKADSEKAKNDTQAPKITLDHSLDKEVSRTSRFMLSGLATDNNKVNSLLVSVNGNSPIRLNLDDQGKFSQSIALKAGDNQIQITATDLAGNVDQKTGSVYFGQTLTAANSHSGALVNGKLYTWGRNNFGQLGFGFTSVIKDNDSVAGSHPITPKYLSQAPKNVVSIAFNQNHSSLLTKEGLVYTWGDDRFGQLGRGDLGRDACAKASENCRLQIGKINNLTNIIAIASGYRHQLALDNKGQVWAYGKNANGALGNGTTTDSSTPVLVDFSKADQASKIIGISASANSSYALDDKGQVWAWGQNKYGNLGQNSLCNPRDNCVDETTRPIKVKLPENTVITEIATGKDHVLALTDQGKVYAWGLNASSQVGYRGEGYKNTDQAWAESIGTPTALPWFSTDKKAKHIYANGNTSYVLLEDGTPYAWGMYGETGANGKTVYPNLNEPTQKPAGLNQVQDMGIGSLYQLARRQDGGIFSWGWSFEGSLGFEAANVWMYPTPSALKFD